MILSRVHTWDTDDDRVSDLDLMLLHTTIAASASPTITAASAGTSTYGIVWPCGACVSMWIAHDICFPDCFPIVSQLFPNLFPCLEFVSLFHGKRELPFSYFSGRNSTCSLLESRVFSSCFENHC